MPPLRRHQLARLTPAGWRRLCAATQDPTAADCLQHWAREGLPLVVTRQPADVPPTESPLALGLPAPLRWQRLRLALQVAWQEVAFFDEFPRPHRVTGLIPAADRPAWLSLCGALDAAGVRVRVYGSHGWQAITGLPCLREGSDLDLIAAVDDEAHADRAAALLACHGQALQRRVDGELMLPDGRAFAWREWQAWREGRTRAVLCKTLDQVALVWRVPARAPVAPVLAEVAG